MRIRVLQLGAVLALAAGSAMADPTITVLPALAPNGFGSPSYAGWQQNAIYALMHGLSTYGDPTLPTYYHQVSNVSQEDVLVTSFPSWHGQANPGGVFGPAFASELGTRVLFGLVINGNGSQFSISQLSFVMSSTDPYNGLGYSFPGGYGYSDGWVGVQKGGDGLLGTSDDVLIKGGASTQLVDALYGRGSGNGYWPSCAPGPCTIAEQQAALDEAAGYNAPDPYLFMGEYSLGGFTGQAQVTITPTPEPFSIVLLGSVVTLLATRLRRKR